MPLNNPVGHTCGRADIQRGLQRGPIPEYRFFSAKTVIKLNPAH